MWCGCADFREMVLHHSITMFLIIFSYILNFVKNGTLVLWLHDMVWR